jgi:hypothetical protein
MRPIRQPGMHFATSLTANVIQMLRLQVNGSLAQVKIPGNASRLSFLTEYKDFIDACSIESPSGR